MNYSFTLVLESNFLKFKKLLSECEKFLNINMKKINKSNASGVQEDLELFLFVTPRQLEFRLPESIDSRKLKKVIDQTKKMIITLFSNRSLGVIYHSETKKSLFEEITEVNIIRLV
ncbi:hypothetical protein V2B35_14735 [Bacillus safensis]|uniref:hypothetical protein n=1 Tax=Bacillus TaxID=1386 RepID=UPI000F7A73F1|nr:MULTISPECIES: hypothetical protein [Bacillus]MCM3368613.1 hypothetical protein [Bacillus safensis]MDJ0291932.1 hypothetical protein [Bacillus safensis]NMW03433.1 hypothetical protein [Bacillus safensis]